MIYLAKYKEVSNRAASLFMNKPMKRTRSKNKFINYSCEGNKRVYTAQRNMCVSLIRKVKKRLFRQSWYQKCTDNEKFRKTVKSFPTDEGMNHDKIILVENEEIILENKQISESSNNVLLML